jgi:hypothetical protein
MGSVGFVVLSVSLEMDDTAHSTIKRIAINKSNSMFMDGINKVQNCDSLTDHFIFDAVDALP